jgi:hypothetical protein
MAEVGGVRETMLGIAVVAAAAGLALGRFLERARRSRKDFGAASTAAGKARKVMIAEVRRAALGFLLLAAFVIAMLMGILGLGGEG